MNPDTASLENLRDIVTPPPVSWWPLALGWWVVLTLLLIVLLWIAVRAFRSWQASAYRRAALREIATATRPGEVAEVLKRTALAAFPRSDVACLTGERWCAWLSRTGGITPTASVQQGLSSGIFSSEKELDFESLTRFASQWIKHHKRPA